MKRPILDEWDRDTYRKLKDKGLDTGMYDWMLAVARLKQAIGKTWIIQKIVKPTVELLAKYLPTQKET